MEEALYDVPLYREFAGLDGGMVRLPDESTILRYSSWARTVWRCKCWRWSMKS
jgi:IS5 family transposase